MSTAGLTTGIIGTALGSLGLLGGLGGAALAANGTNGMTTNGRIIGDACLVSKDQFYQTLISQINTQADRDISVERRFAGIEAAIAVNTTANSYQNAAVETRFNSEATINNLILNLAICEATKNAVKGEVFLSPRHLADNYVSPTRVLESHEARVYGPRGFCGGHNEAFGGCGCAPCGR